jgi:hypothetical protein
MLAILGTDLDVFYIFCLAKSLNFGAIYESHIFCIGFIAHNYHVDIWECIFFDLNDNLYTSPSQKLLIS